MKLNQSLHCVVPQGYLPLTLELTATVLLVVRTGIMCHRSTQVCNLHNTYYMFGMGSVFGQQHEERNLRPCGCKQQKSLQTIGLNLRSLVYHSYTQGELQCYICWFSSFFFNYKKQFMHKGKEALHSWQLISKCT